MTPYISEQSRIINKTKIQEAVAPQSAPREMLFDFLKAIKSVLKNPNRNRENPELQELISAYQLLVRENPDLVAAGKDPFPDYLDHNSIREEDLPAIMNRMNDLLPLDEPNTQLEYSKCFEKVSDHTVEQVYRLQQEETALHNNIKKMNRLSDELSKIEEEARKDDKDKISLNSDMLDRLEEFWDDSWPEIEGSNIRTIDISLIKSRLTSKISETNHEMSRVLFKIERESKKLSQYLDLVIHGTRRNSMIDACVRASRSH
jgi:hypothetical protein